MSCENNNIENRGAVVPIYVSNDTVFDKTLTFTAVDGVALDLSGYTNFIFRIETDPKTEYTKTDGDMSVAANVVTCDFVVDIPEGNYNYQFLGVTATGEKEFLRGKFKVS